jgi:hypothetical protein
MVPIKMIPGPTVRWNFLVLILIAILLSSCKTSEVSVEPAVPSDYDYTLMTAKQQAVHKAAESYLQLRYQTRLGDDPVIVRAIRLTEVRIDEERKRADIIFNPRMADYPIRPATLVRADSVIRSQLTAELLQYDLHFFSMGYNLRELIPNYYQEDRSEIDFLRRPMGGEYRPVSMVRNLDQPWMAPSGLQGRHIALWHSHGWYYNLREARWEWQRPRLFNITEDLLPLSYTLPYIIPMLESAGAHVWVARERDTQHHMVIVDNDQPSVAGRYIEAQNRADVTWQTGQSPGFNPSVLPLTDQTNPFQAGSWRYSRTDTMVTATAVWTPDIPQTGQYAVYVSYTSGPDRTTDARYTVYHSAGSTDFSVNQQIGGGTWVYLGHFHFEEGSNPGSGAVELTNYSVQAGNFITADAVRFGGGQGLIVRNERTSGRARYLEGARYHLQFSGAPDSLVWKLNEANDYTDDFQSRGEWVNYLRGTPFGPNINRGAGLGIPIELSLSFHTDAGVTRNDDVIGTLSIYTIDDMQNRPYFPDGSSRLANRDFTDIMQTQIVDDIRSLYDPRWVRRALRNARYSESARPNVPSTLLELLSHQNFRDMQYAMDPHFRFDVSRAIYKSMLRFLSSQYDFPYVVQPLPVTHLAAVYRDGAVHLSWRPQTDPLEPSAEPDQYVVYTRIEQNGFDNGTAVGDSSLVFRDLVPGVIYSFKVRAANAGGVSMPSEIVSVMLPDTRTARSAQLVLIVNGFTRISAPALVNEPGFRGFARFLDAGVPDGYDYGFVGDQYNFDVYSDWVSDDRPGHGASHGNYETQILAGNTRDFAVMHGIAIREAGYGFVTVSEAALEAGVVSPGEYRLVNLLLGNQRQIRHVNPFTEQVRGMPYGIYSVAMRDFLRETAVRGGGIFVSGAHVGTDLILRPQPDSSLAVFAAEVLGYVPITNHASFTGGVLVADRLGDAASSDAAKVSSVNDGRTVAGTAAASNRQIVTSPTELTLPFGSFAFNADNSATIYRVDAPDAIGPAGPQSRTLFRYAENEFSAATLYKGQHRVVVLGFPFETILNSEVRVELMRSILEFLD